MPPARAAKLAAAKAAQPAKSMDPFQAALGLENDLLQFVAIKTTLRGLIRKHFDFNLRSAQQPKSTWDAFIVEALEHFPFIEENADRLLNLRRYSSQYLSAIGNKYRTIRSRCDDTFANRSVRAKRSARSPGKLEGVPLTNKNRQFEIVIPPLTRKKFVPGSSGKDQAASASTSITKLDSTVAISKFLESCKPCMSGLFPVFVKLGIKDDSCLDGVLAWPKHELSQVLNKWKSGKMLNELQVEALRIGFDKLRSQLSLNSQKV